MHSQIKPFYTLIEDLIERMDGVFSNLPEEALDWTPNTGMNSMCILIVHTAGSLRYWVGEMIGGETCQRDRQSEFQVKDLSSGELHTVLYDALATAKSVLATLDITRFDEKVYSSVYNDYFTVAFALAHALEHTALHLGHMEITKEMWLKFSWEQ
jgi:hypothetical protein